MATEKSHLHYIYSFSVTVNMIFLREFRELDDPVYPLFIQHKTKWTKILHNNILIRNVVV